VVEERWQNETVEERERYRELEKSENEAARERDERG
jgi:hypothetical protein